MITLQGFIFGFVAGFILSYIFILAIIKIFKDDE